MWAGVKRVVIEEEGAQREAGAEQGVCDCCGVQKEHNTA